MAKKAKPAPVAKKSATASSKKTAKAPAAKPAKTTSAKTKKPTAKVSAAAVKSPKVNPQAVASKSDAKKTGKKSVTKEKIALAPVVESKSAKKKPAETQAEPEGVKKVAKASVAVAKVVPTVMGPDLGSAPEESESTGEAAVVEKKSKKRDDLKIDRNGDLEQQWKNLFDRSKGVKAPPYKMSETYEARTPVMHKVLGWGFVISNQNNRLEVLFKDGIKILVANYKAS